MHIYMINGAVPVILSCTDHMFLVFELSTRDCVAHVFLLRTDHMNLQTYSFSIYFALILMNASAL